MDARHSAEEDVVGSPVPATVIHDQSILLGEVRATAEVGVARGVGVAMMLPFRVFSTRIHYLDPASGEEVMLAGPEIHHRDETLYGLADAWLTAHVQIVVAELTLDLRAGTTLPLGFTVPDPFVLGAMGVAHEHVQFGTGTFNVVAGAEARWDAGAVSVGGFVLTQQVLYENRHGFLAGDRYAAGAGVESALFTKAFAFALGVELQAETAEKWSGVVPTEDGNQGRLDLLASTAVTWRVSPALAVHVEVKVPFFTHVVGGKLRYPVILGLSLATNFDLLGKAAAAGEAAEHAHHHHDHDHDAGAHDDHDAGAHDEHGDTGSASAPAPAAAPAPPDWTGADVASVADAGEAVDLVPVPGVVTVFDFWAPWCAPCHALDRKLAPLARSHPGRLAVRTLNVVDWDSPAAARYLKDPPRGLPHVKVYGADGALLFERSGDPDEIAAAVAAALGGPAP